MFDAPEPQAEPAPALAVSPAGAKKDSHPGKKPVLIHIPETMHKDLRRLWQITAASPVRRGELRRFVAICPAPEDTCARAWPRRPTLPQPAGRP
jgi:hypothetical protein